MHSKKSHPLSDLHQTPWQLAAIQLSGWTSLPILATSIYILKENSFLGAVLTIIVGNALLWFIRLGLVAMSYPKRESALDIAKEYLGEAGNYCIAILLLAATLFWFIAQTTTGSNSITQLLSLKQNPNIDQFTQVSVLLGLISTLFCMGGMVLLRWLSIIAFPILVIGFFIIFFALPAGLPAENHQPLSFAGLTLVLSTNLGISADLPTFFRHSNSWKAAIYGLTIVQLVSIALGICSLFLGSIITEGWELNHSAIYAAESELLRVVLIGFIFISLVCANVANVYAASVGWELVAPKALVGRKEYFILGLGLTTIFILVYGLFSVTLFLHIADSSLVNLSIVLIMGYIIRRQMKRQPNFFEKTTYFTAWLLASIVNLFQNLHLILNEFSTLLIGTLVAVSVISLGFFGKRLWNWRKSK